MAGESAGKSPRGWSALEVLTLLTVFVILFASTASVIVFVIEHRQANLTLGTAKNVNYAINAVSKSYYASGGQLFDGGSESGLTSEAEDLVRRYSGAEGEICLIRSGDGNTVLRLTYSENGYTAEYRLEDGKSSWSVWRKRVILGGKYTALK